MLALLSQRDFCLLWIAHTISILGDYVFFIAITYWMYEQTGSSIATGAVLIASAIPSLLFAPLAGVLVDRWNRRAIMFTAESARAVLFLGLLAIFMARPHTIWPVYVIGFGQSALAAFFWPARSALLPQLVKPSSLFTANALFMASDSSVRIIAPFLSTFLLLLWGAPGVIVVDAATFVVSAGSICLLTIPFFPLRQAREQQRKKGEHPSINVICRLRGPFILGAVVSHTAGTLGILSPIFIRQFFPSEPAGYGWILTSQAVGEGIVSLLLGKIYRKKRRSQVLSIRPGYLAMGGCSLMLLACFHTLISSLMLNLIFGATTAATTIQLLTFLQESTTSQFLGRVLASYTAVQALAQVVGMVIASLAVSSFGTIPLLLCDGILYLIGSCLAWTLSYCNAAQVGKSAQKRVR